MSDVGWPVCEALPYAIVRLAPDGRVAWWNTAAADLLRWPAPSDRGSQQYLPRELEALEQKGSAEAVEMRLERAGSPAATVTVALRPLTGDRGELAGTILVIEDITDRRRGENEARQAERLEAMAQLSGVVAHDFNNLLTTIIGYNQMLSQQLQHDPAARESVDAIDRAAKRARELTSGLASVGRRRVVQPELLDLAERVLSLEPVLQRLVKDEVELRIVASDERAQARLDPNELGQAVTNLVLNADEAMPEGGRLVVDIRPVMLLEGASGCGPDAGPYVVVTVGDTGVGMTDEVRQRCFDPFFSTKHRRQGAGIGLTAVYGVVSQVGGRIEVHSRPGGGSTVRLYLPAAAGAAAPQPVTSPERRRRERRLRVLVVDDQSEIRILVRAILEARGHVVEEAEDAKTAVEIAAAAERPFHLLLSDIVMPGEHGDVLARRLMDLQPDLHVLLMSGYVERAASLDPTRVSFLAKPFAPDELADMVARVAPRRRVHA